MHHLAARLYPDLLGKLTALPHTPGWLSMWGPLKRKAEEGTRRGGEKWESREKER